MKNLQKIKRCFIIGPMENIQKLEKLREKIIKPILEPLGFTVATPDEGEIGNIMRQVLLNLEQADLLIADITGSTPNVMYEMGVYHAFGKPYLTLKDSVPSKKNVATPFDIAEYRYHEIDYENTTAAKQKLRPLLKKIITKIDQIDWFGNPVTDFYQSPIAEIPTAIGLYKNYKKNFLDMVFPHVFQKDEKGKNYKVDVYIETRRKDNTGKPVMRALTIKERAQLRAEILIPKEMSTSNHNVIKGLKDNNTIDFLEAEVGRRTRPFKLHYRKDNDGKIILLDIPTILSTLNESINVRRDIHADQIAKSDWEILEKQELERFAGKCDAYRQRLRKEFPECIDKVKVTIDWIPGY